jgi:23S rRNA (cytosine1962-C5)-methyltransferase
MSGQAPLQANIPQLDLLSTPDWEDYELLDSGNGKKLERYGPYTFERPEHQAVWRPALLEKEWRAADAVFEPGGGESGGDWRFNRRMDSSWQMNYKGLRFQAYTSGSRHMGVFPEQAAHWDWIETTIKRAMERAPEQPINVLNLFGYTGLATLAAARTGAYLTHVDASKKAIGQARRNQAISGLEDRPIRWLVDDAFKFVQREIRRGNRYEAILLDPPKFGRGPKGQVWELFESLSSLLAGCRELLSEQALFVVITAYAIRASALTVYYALDEMLEGRDGHIDAGELVLIERSAGRLLSTAIYARWSARPG